jgi:hypothetical protein
MELKLLRVALTKCANVRLNARFGGILLTVTLLTSCATSWTKLGSLTMVATRNIDSKTEYKELARYVEGVDKGNYDSDKKKYKGTLSSAIDECVKSVDGGEFLKNIEVYISNGKVKVVADVWGYRAPGFITKQQQEKLDAEKEQHAKQVAQDKKDFEQERKQAERKLAKEKKEADQKLIDEKKDEEDAKLAASFKIGDQVRFKNNPLSNNLTKGLVIGKKDTWNATIKYTNDKGEEKISHSRRIHRG